MDEIGDAAIEAGGVVLPGRLAIPAHARAAVLFAHGSGSSRFSPRNAGVAEVFRAAGMATLLFDLLTAEEAADRSNVFDVALCSDRLIAATEFISGRAEFDDAAIGYFGASTGAAAALRASVVLGGLVGAVVSRGGRPDLAGADLPRVTAPTLLVVGSRDTVVADLNRRALEQLGGVAEMAVVPNAGHLFEEPGALDEVSRLAVAWFRSYLFEPDPAA